MLQKIINYLKNQDLLFCPCCKKYSKKFLEYGLVPRKNAQCPSCESLERHRLLLLYLKNETSLFKKNIRLLHFAPEQSLYNIFSTLNIDYITTDLSSDLAEFKASIDSLPFEDDSFDMIICYHVLEHVKDDQKGMREMYRVLRKGGIALIQSTVFNNLSQTYEDPKITSPSARIKAFGQHDHVRKYGTDFFNRLSRAGFNITIDDYAKKLGENKVKRYALNPFEGIYLCLK